MGPGLRRGDALWAIVAIASAVPAAAEPSAQLCGIDAANVAALHARTAADPRYKRDGGEDARDIWSAESIQAILTFTKAGDPAHPAAICQQVIDKEGTMRIDRQVRCEGAAPACAALDKAEDGSGDGE